MANKTIAVDGRKYEIVVPALRYNNKVYTSEDIAANEAIQKALLEQAWKGPLGERDEFEFDNNGIFKIVYEGKAAKTAAAAPAAEGEKKTAGAAKK